MRRLWHLPELVCSFVGSILLIWLWAPFAGMGTGLLIVTLLSALAISHVLACLAGLFLLKASWRRHALVLAIGLGPALLFSLMQARQAYYLKYQAVYDRFRDDLANPIPKSVRNLRFNPLSETINPDLNFRFDISPKDLRDIITSKHLEPVEPDKLLCPEDYFKYPYYLPVPGEFVLYQGRDANGDVLTLKVTKAHDHVVFRRESDAYYANHYWDLNPTLVKMGQNDLERLKKRWTDEQVDAPNERR